MCNIALETKNQQQEKLKAYLEQNASETLADKINNGVKIVKDGKTLLNKKTLDGFMDFALEEATATIIFTVLFSHKISIILSLLSRAVTISPPFCNSIISSKVPGSSVLLKSFFNFFKKFCNKKSEQKNPTKPIMGLGNFCSPRRT